MYFLHPGCFGTRRYLGASPVAPDATLVVRGRIATRTATLGIGVDIRQQLGVNLVVDIRHQWHKTNPDSTYCKARLTF